MSFDFKGLKMWHLTLLKGQHLFALTSTIQKNQEYSSQNYIQIPFILQQVWEIRNGFEEPLTWALKRTFLDIIQVRSEKRTLMTHT
jgi:hypothetical protein